MTVHDLRLVGGGPGATLALRRHFKAALAALGKPKPSVAYVGAASDDNHGFFTMIRGALALGSSARMELAKIASPHAKASGARALLEGCDLVFVSGGDVEHGMRVLHDRDLARTLVSLGEGGKPFFGISRSDHAKTHVTEGILQQFEHRLLVVNNHNQRLTSVLRGIQELLLLRRPRR